MADKRKRKVKPPKCPECGGKRVWRVGVVPTRSGPKKRYKCFSCARTFYVEKPKKARK